MHKSHILFSLLIAAAPYVVAKTPMPERQWVECGPGVKLLDHYYSPGVSFRWEGDAKGGKAHGQGVLTMYVDGAKAATVNGSCKNGVLSGPGVLTTEKGVTLSGVFEDGMLEGVGSVSIPDDAQYLGEFINNTLHGKAQVLYADMSMFEGTIARQKPRTGVFSNSVGPLFYIYKGSVVSALPKPADYQPAIGKPVKELLDENEEVTFSADAPYYRLVTYASANRPKGEVKEFYANGAVRRQATPLYLDASDAEMNFYEGPYKVYYKSGNIQSEGYFLNNMQHGKWTYYNQDASKRSENNYRLGVPHGDWIDYDEETQQIIRVKKYRDGLLPDNKYLFIDGFGYYATYHLVYEADFRRMKKELEIDNQSGFVKVKDSYSMLMRANPSKTVAANMCVLASGSYSTQVSVDAVRGSRDAKGIVALLVGFKDWDNYYALTVKEGMSRVVEVRDGVAQELSKPERIQSTSINEYELQATLAGTSLTFWIDGYEVCSVSDANLPGNQCLISFYNDSSEAEDVRIECFNVTENIAEMSSLTDYYPDTDDVWTSSGSGFFVNPEGYIATNYHVVEGASENVHVMLNEGDEQRLYTAQVVATDRDNDMAIVKITDAKFKPFKVLPYTIVGSQLPIGSEVFAMGYPKIQDLGTNIKLTEGIISSKAGMHGDKRFYQMSAQIQPGNSGGPLFDLEGNLVGINTSAYTGRGDYVPQNVNYSIKSTMLRNFVAEECDFSIDASGQYKKGRSIAELASAYEPYVALVLVK